MRKVGAAQMLARDAVQHGFLRLLHAGKVRLACLAAFFTDTVGNSEKGGMGHGALCKDVTGFYQ